MDNLNGNDKYFLTMVAWLNNLMIYNYYFLKECEKIISKMILIPTSKDAYLAVCRYNFLFQF